MPVKVYSNNDYLVFFEECKLVEGYYSNIIYDLVRSDNSNEVPKSFVDFYHRSKNTDLKSLVESYNPAEQILVLEYIDFVIEREFAVITDVHLKTNLINYPNEYEIPSLIENAIIVVESVNKTYFNKIIKNLENLGVLAIEIRIIKPKINDFELIEELFENTVIETIIQRSFYSEEILDRLRDVNFIRTKEISLYNAPENKKVKIIHLLKLIVNFNTSWNREFRKPFTIDRRFYIEAQRSLAYFYSKLFIGSNGEIKNAPECQEIHANLHEIADYNELKKIVTSGSFQKYWHISKNEVEICKDCEFRFMCLDNRIPIQRKSDGAFFYEQQCNYNPFINKWSDEEGYLFLEDCGVLSNHIEFQIDHQKIKRINELLGNH